MKTMWFLAHEFPRCFDQELDAVDFASRDIQRLVGETQRRVARKSPYADTIEGGTLENVSESVRTTVQEQVMPATSMVLPEFTALADSCGKVGGTDQLGFTEFIITPGNYRGRGPKICIKGTRTGFAQEYPIAVEGLKRNIVLLTNADIRANYLQNGGCKLSAASGSSSSFAKDFRGDTNNVQQPWPDVVPDSPLSFAGLQYVARHLREALDVEPFENPVTDNGLMKYIGSADSIDLFRDELNIRSDNSALTQGQYKQGADSIRGYTWEGPYRGISFGIDPDPIRATGFTETSVTYMGQTFNTQVPTYVEPWIQTPVTTGFAARRNPAWVFAPYEVGFLFGMRPFKRLVPASYGRMEGWPFIPQITNGSLEFKQLVDRGTMTLGDYGQHFYEIERAYQPMVPHACLAIIYARCSGGLDFTACGNLANYS
jgi:hypothetical protein